MVGRREVKPKLVRGLGLLLMVFLLSLFCLFSSSTSAFGVTFAQAQAAGKRLAAGYSHSLALKVDNTVIAWGDDTYGQGSVPAGLTDVVQISAGYYHNLALKEDGTVVAWGKTEEGQCTLPGSLAGVKVMAVAAGGYHSLAIKSNGTVVAWGNNDSGQCDVPADLTNVTAIAAGDAHSLALKSDGTVVAWGANGAWQCEVPAGLSNVIAIAAGYDFSVALSGSGAVETWGNFDKYSPTDHGVIAAGGSHLLTTRYWEDTLVRARGDNTYGQCDVPQGLSLTGYLTDIIISEGELSPAFDPNLINMYYNVKVPNNVEYIDVAAITEHANQGLYIYDYSNQANSGRPASGEAVRIPLKVGVTRIDINLYLPAIGEGIYSWYHLNVERASADTDLKELKTSFALEPGFKPEDTAYTVNVDEDMESIDITATANNPEAHVSIGEYVSGTGTQTATIPLTYGETFVDIVVENNGESKTYTLLVKKAGFLQSLSVSGGQLSPIFYPETYNYFVGANSNADSLEIIPTLKEAAHELLIDGQAHENSVVKEISLSGENQ